MRTWAEPAIFKYAMFFNEYSFSIISNLFDKSYALSSGVARNFNRGGGIISTFFPAFFFFFFLSRTKLKLIEKQERY